MFILSYAASRMKRSLPGCSTLMLLSLAFVIFLCSLNDILEQKERQLDEVYGNLEVECRVSDIRGTQTDSLYIKDYILSLFLSGESFFLGKKDEIPFSSYVRDLKLKLTLKYEMIADGGEVFIPNILNASNLTGLTHLAADSTLTPENGIGITYFGDNSEEIFLQDNPVCIVSEELYQTLPRDDRGDCYLQLAVGDPAQSGQVYAWQQLQVAGTYDGAGKNIYCPWEIIKALSVELTGMLHADSLSFTVADNRRMDTFKELLARYFTSVDATGAVTEYTASDILTSYEYAVTVYDGIFNKTVSEIRDNIDTLKILKPVIIVLALGIGFFAGVLFVRNRRQEFAVMRSLGTKKGMVFFEAFIEQLFLGLTGAVLGLAAYSAWHMSGFLPPLGTVGAYLLCYLTGSGIAAYWITKVKVMAILKEKE